MWGITASNGPTATAANGGPLGIPGAGRAAGPTDRDAGAAGGVVSLPLASIVLRPSALHGPLPQAANARTRVQHQSIFLI
jgi:hypothetical protein